MSKTIYFAAATLDGFLADENDGIDWLTGFEPHPAADSDLPRADTAIDEFLEGVGAVIMGSATYEFILPYEWSYGDRPAWVLTSRDLPEADGADIRFHDGPVTDIHPAIAEAAGDGDIWHVGGGGIASDLFEAGLLDEVRVTVVPIVLGAGKPLFARPTPSPMALISTTPYAGGMVELHYSLTPPPG